MININVRLRDSTRKLRANLSFFFNTKETKYEKKDYKILSEIHVEASKINFSKEDKLDTHQIFSQKILNIIKKKKLLNFLQNSFIQQMFFIHNRFFILFELIEMRSSKNWSEWKKLIKENNIGNPIRYFLYPRSSGNKIHQVYHLKKYNDYSKINLKEFSNIIEFGGGYGNMATIFNKINKSSNYIIFDTKEVSLLQYYYLKKNKLDVSLNKNNNSKIKLISDIAKLKQIVDKINTKDKNLFIANWSFSEIPIEFRKKLFFIFKKFNYQIFSFQHYFEKIDNLKYFNKIKKINVRNNFQSKIIDLKSKKNNYYLFNYKKLD